MTAMHPWIAELRGRGLSDVAIAYELSTEPASLDALQPNDAQLAVLSNLRRGAGARHDGPSIAARDPFCVQTTYFGGGALLLEWFATTRAARDSVAEDIPTRLAMLCGDPDLVDVVFRVGPASTGARTLLEWERRWSDARRVHGHSLLDVIVSSVVARTYGRDTSLLREGPFGALVTPRRNAQVWQAADHERSADAPSEAA